MCACACVPRRACARVCVRACASACMCVCAPVNEAARWGSNRVGDAHALNSICSSSTFSRLQRRATVANHKHAVCPTLGAKRAPPEKSPARTSEGAHRQCLYVCSRTPPCCSCSRNYSHGRSCAPRERVCIECHPCRRVLRLRAVQRGKPPLREVPRQQRAAQHSTAQYSVPQRPAAGQARKRDLVATGGFSAEVRKH
jgi:hypothetical protein